MPKVIDLPTATSMSDSDYLIMEASGGGTKLITLANAKSNQLLWAGNSSALTVANNTVTDLVSLTLTSGKWLIVAQCAADGGSTEGLCTLCLSTVSGTNQPTSGSYIAQQMAAGWMSLMVSKIIEVTNSQTIYLVFMHRNTGKRTVAVNAANMRALRIG